jgi:hypothetical protein
MANNKGRQIQVHEFLDRYFIVLNIFIVIVILLASYFFLIKPKIDLTITGIKENISIQQNALNVQRKKLADMEAALDFYRQIGDQELDEIISVLPNKYPKEKLFGEIEDVIIQNGFRLSDISLNLMEEVDLESLAPEINSLSSANNLGIIDINMTVSLVDYSNLKQFLSILERNLPLMDILNLSFSPGGDSLGLEVRTYYFKP